MPMTVTAGEMLVRLSIAFDKRGMAKARTAIEKFDAAINSFGKGLLAATAALAAGRMFGSFIQRASDANETLNVLEETMGDHTDSIISWSQQLAKGVGRSEFQLQKYASEIAALVTPTLRATESAKTLSTGFAQLAVDLSSFFNTTESDALQALQSALTGQVKPMRRYGVNLIQANLQQFAFDQGIRKTVKDMTEAERQLLRYNFIMQMTRNAQGDAARTADMFANASRGARDALVDVGTRIGLNFVRDVNKALVIIRNFAFGLSELEENSQILSKAFKALGVAFAVGFARVAFPLLKGFLLRWVPIIAVVTFLLALFDEIVSFFEGDFTLVGGILDAVLGVGAAKSIRDSWVKTYEDMKKSALEYFVTSKKEATELERGLFSVQGAAISLGMGIVAVFELVWDNLVNGLKDFANSFIQVNNWAVEGINKIFSVLSGGKAKRIKGIDYFQMQDPQRNFEKTMSIMEDSLRTLGRARIATEAGRLESGVNIKTIQTPSGPRTVRFGRGITEERALSQSVNRKGEKIFPNVTVNINGDVVGEDLGKIQDIIQQAVAESVTQVAEDEEQRVPEYQPTLETGL